MKRKGILYPPAFTIAAIIWRRDNDASIKQIYSIAVQTPGGPGPPLKSHHQILRNMESLKYVAHSSDESKPYGHRVRWHLTEQGQHVLIATKRYYYFALRLLG